MTIEISNREGYVVSVLTKYSMIRRQIENVLNKKTKISENELKFGIYLSERGVVNYGDEGPVFIEKFSNDLYKIERSCAYDSWCRNMGIEE